MKGNRTISDPSRCCREKEIISTNYLLDGSFLQLTEDAPPDVIRHHGLDLDDGWNVSMRERDLRTLVEERWIISLYIL